MRVRSSALVFLLGIAFAGAPSTSSAQLGALKRKAEEAKKKIEESSKKDSTKTKSDTVKATAPASPSSSTSQPPAPSPNATSATAAPAPKADAKVWENYDFVPGNKVMFFTDFSEDRVGNFARGLKYRSGPAEVVERDGIKVLRATGRSEFLIPVGKKLPERFTLEIDVLAPLPADGEHDTGEMLTFEGGADDNRGPQSASVVWMPSVAWITGGGQHSPASRVTTPPAMLPVLRGTVAHLRVLMDSAYFKMYANERRLYNIPELALRRDSVIRLMLNASENEPVFLTSIRVAESETDVMYDALSSKGRWVTQGILFETGKAVLQPESRPVLKEIASTMKKYGDLKILIEGHTDNVGAAASNLTLSDQRAAAVKAALATDFGIDGARITTKGFGDTKPAVPNATAVGRAQNRRVEIVKQ